MTRAQQVQMHLAFAVGYLEQEKLDRANGRDPSFAIEHRRKHRLALVKLRCGQ